jgi:Phosphomannose isomerase
MQANLERVISAVEENEVIEGTTIVNTTYDCAGYRISYISMSKGTFMSPERFRSPTLIYVMKGVLRIAIMGKNNRREARITTGQGYFHPAQEYAGYYADESNVIFTEIVLRTDSEIAMRIIPHSPQDLIHLVHYEPGQISRSHLINDEFFQLTLSACSEPERKEFFSDKQPVVVHCMEGRVTLLHNEEQFSLQKGNSFIIPMNYQCTISVSGRTKLAVLYLADTKKQFI